MTDFISLCAITAICSATVLIVSKGEKELAMLVSSVIYIIVMIYAITCAGELIETIKGNFENLHNIDSINTLIKVGGIAIVSSIASSLCENTGQRGVSAAIEILAIIEILGLTTPLIFELFNGLLNIIGD